MSDFIQIDTESQTPVYKQIVQQVTAAVRSNILLAGTILPSMNELSARTGISKETVKKAYSLLRDKGVVDARQGKGFYVAARGDADKLHILLLFDKLSTYKQVILQSLTQHLGDRAEITIRLHNQNTDLLEYYLDENLDLYDYYLVTPHFLLDAHTQQCVLHLLNRIPNRKLILVDHTLEALRGNYGAVYQDFESDIAEGLRMGLKKLRRFERLNVLIMPSSLYGEQISRAVCRFCSENGIATQLHTTITPDIIRSKEVYLILNSQFDFGLIQLVRMAREKQLKVGRDLSIISYNESPINEIILNGLTTVSTDFEQMGAWVAEMLLSGHLEKRKCDFRMTFRSTF